MPTDLAWRQLRQGYAALPLARPPVTPDDAHEARLLARRVLVVRGEEGARAFYDDSMVRRAGAVPRLLSDLLFGRGAVHGLDDDEHAARKRMFLDVVAEPAVDRLADAVADDLEDRVANWRGRPSVVLFDELVEAYGTSVLTWADLRLSPPDAIRASHDLARIVDGFGGRGTAFARAWAARRRCERWAVVQVREVRAGDREPRPASALAVFAGAPLDEHTAAVELLNVVRPTVAVAWFGTFAALALCQEAPEWRDRLATDAQAREAFAHEVRRFYPFVPALVARARTTFSWRGFTVPVGRRLVLDVHGTDRDDRVFEQPQVFDPARFLTAMPNPYQFLPQGGGHPEAGHRCPGERITLRLLDVTLRELARTPYDVLGGHRVPVRRIPTRPEGGLVIGVGAVGARGSR